MLNKIAFAVLVIVTAFNTATLVYLSERTERHWETTKDLMGSDLIYNLDAHQDMQRQISALRISNAKCCPSE